jgi:hypothetical protein
MHRRVRLPARQLIRPEVSMPEPAWSGVPRYLGRFTTERDPHPRAGPRVRIRLPPPASLQTLGPSRHGRLQPGPPLIGWIGFTGAFRLVLDWPAMTGTRTLRSDEPLAVELTAAPKQGEVNGLRQLLARTLGPPSDNNGFRGSTARPSSASVSPACILTPRARPARAPQRPGQTRRTP